MPGSVYPLTPDRVLRVSRDYDIIRTSVVAQKEVRRARNSTGNPRKDWLLLHDHINLTDATTLINFFKGRRGRWDDFTFTDPADNISYRVRFSDDVLDIEKPLGRIENPLFRIEVKIKEVL